MQIEQHNLDSLRKLVRDLQEENETLKSLLKENHISYEDRNVLEEQPLSDEYDEDQGSRILPLNPDEAMARLFLSYFKGRTDVFARRGKKCGYFPQCDGYFHNPNCPKKQDKKTFCDEDCPHKAWKQLQMRRILYHLQGNLEDCTDVIGVYPLFPDNTCRFLVFDFDNHANYENDDANTDDLWKSEVDALRRICDINNIDALVERSRSGRGAHLWIFFSEPVNASLARSFGFALLDRGASSVNLPSFRYYDRMYPSQDVLSKLGNLVALPLQGQALKHGNSAFIDHAWNAYPDQWKKLLAVRKLSAQNLNEYLEKWNVEALTDRTETKYRKDRLQVRPWKKDDRFHKEDAVGEVLHIVLENGVFVDTLNLLPRLQNQIKGMATIDNPEFYKNRAIGRSNFYNLRTISVWNEINGYINVPIGLLKTIQSKAKESGLACDIVDKRCHGRPIRVRFKGELREQQEYAAAALERYENGVLSAPTAFGKTVLAVYLISRRKVNTLVLLSSKPLITQWINEFEKFLEIDEKPPVYYTKTGIEKRHDGVIGTLKDGQDKTTGIIDFALVGSAYHSGKFFANIDSYGMVLVDECHHIASSQAQQLMQRIRAKYIYGMSATPNRSDKRDDIIYMLLGPLRHKYTAKEQADAQGLNRFVIPRFTRVVNITGKKLEIHEADAMIADNAVRNSLIVEDTEKVIAQKRTPVILTKLKKHAETLFDLLRDKADHVFLVYGGQTEKQNEEIINKMLALPHSESLILIATGQKVGEGFNFPRLDTLMLAAPLKFDGRLVQYVGRLNRIYEGKDQVLVYDYVDTHISFFDRQYKNRLTTYKRLGYQVMSDPLSVKQTVNAIYDRSDYSEVFERDLIEADSEIIIASPKLIRRRVERMITLVKQRQEAGVTVTVITLNPENEHYDDTNEKFALIDEMKQKGIFVRITEEESEHYAVVDRKLVWHGGMNLLGKADIWDNLIRVENEQAASELLELSELDLQKKE